MSRTSGKRAFVATQAMSPVSDFNTAFKAFRDTLTWANRRGMTDVQNDAASHANAQAIDQLLSIPVSDPVNVAQKVEAFHALHATTDGRLLSDPSAQTKIAHGNDDEEKGLLALYLDLIGMKVEPTQPSSVASGKLADRMAELQKAHQDFNHAASLTDSVALGREPRRAETVIWEAAHNAQETAVANLRDCACKTVAEVSVKLETLSAVVGDDHVDINANLEAIRADLQRLAATNDRSEWEAAEAHYVAATQARDAALEAMKSHTRVPKKLEAAWGSADDAQVTAWGRLVRTPAPDAAATVVKMKAFIEAAYVEHVGEHPNDPATLQRMVSEGGVDEGWPVVYLLQDALRQSGEIASPLLAAARPIPTEEGRS